MCIDAFVGSLQSAEIKFFFLFLNTSIRFPNDKTNDFLSRSFLDPLASSSSSFDCSEKNSNGKWRENDRWLCLRLEREIKTGMTFLAFLFFFFFFCFHHRLRVCACNKWIHVNVPPLLFFPSLSVLFITLSCVISFVVLITKRTNDILHSTSSIIVYTKENSKQTQTHCFSLLVPFYLMQCIQGFQVASEGRQLENNSISLVFHWPFRKIGVEALFVDEENRPFVRDAEGCLLLTLHRTESIQDVAAMWMDVFLLITSVEHPVGTYLARSIDSHRSNASPSLAISLPGTGSSPVLILNSADKETGSTRSWRSSFWMPTSTEEMYLAFSSRLQKLPYIIQWRQTLEWKKGCFAYSMWIMKPGNAETARYFWPFKVKLNAVI